MDNDPQITLDFVIVFSSSPSYSYSTPPTTPPPSPETLDGNDIEDTAMDMDIPIENQDAEYIDDTDGDDVNDDYNDDDSGGGGEEDKEKDREERMLIEHHEESSDSDYNSNYQTPPSNDDDDIECDYIYSQQQEMSSSTTATAAAATATQDEQSESSKRKSTQTPTLTEEIRSETLVPEDEMIGHINIAIRRLLTRPNHQSPYRYNFRWTIHEEPDLHYRVFLCIREPSSLSRRISR